MPPKINSRHELTTAIDDANTSKRVLTERVPFRFRDLDDNTHHTVGAGDTLFTIAGQIYDGFTDRSCGLWWVIADFQPDPIIDPTLALEEGRLIVAPSERTVREEILNPKRRVLF